MEVYATRYVSNLQTNFPGNVFLRVPSWPSPNIAAHVAPRAFAQVSALADPQKPITSAPLCLLPTEILLLVIPDLSLWSLLSLSAACRQLRSLITNPSFLLTVLTEAITDGSMRWVLPVHGLLQEEERAFNALRLWLPEAVRPSVYERPLPPIDEEEPCMVLGDDDDSTYGFRVTRRPWYHVRRVLPKQNVPRVEPLLQHKDFPLFAFIRACWESDSMMNRKRLWGMVKQFDGLWRDYRWRGWEVKRFFPSEEIIDQLPEEHEGCRPPCER